MSCRHACKHSLPHWVAHTQACSRHTHWYAFSTLFAERSAAAIAWQRHCFWTLRGIPGLHLVPVSFIMAQSSEVAPELGCPPDVAEVISSSAAELRWRLSAADSEHFWAGATLEENGGRSDPTWFSNIITKFSVGKLGTSSVCKIVEESSRWANERSPTNSTNPKNLGAIPMSRKVLCGFEETEMLLIVFTYQTSKICTLNCVHLIESEEGC